ncbi:TonB-dependent receptor plug domain-containing protein [Tenacibaculum finnmarkense]|uniref:TonB-dependent receptor plug domain-containing protein n=1 Tax=Tenacibaculum finnmarkense TaxID=2781243 RepID=UPI001E38FC59|nr:TonB-dependent receptor plug domain-containing protein [Tenacibaculum finnmarkense]MCD8399319.1 TonB-dependent receptor [Tenacibaculum finnmarkense genomovar ulcerans]MCG8784797.1 TonB-dependent receptor plug domain-containing protein [Tenacibaculum finnmarkense]MCG8794701.1 TonB-dependent receptor plug domain-containing protein [Tenacibaculum finnmarkense]MCG8797029.1 TonB-dependent receptor plug domain-containing protein [Tenacibaculum finnmarkense]MCG8813136.1 TonB-dependent receptor plu
MLKKQLIGMFFIFCSVITYAQIEIKGGVYDEYLEPFYNAKITIKTESTTTFTDGKFALKTLRKLPVTLIISAFGYQTEKRIIRSLDTPINIILKESLLLDQIVISASRVSEKIIESPVTIERFGLTEVKNTSANSFYSGLANLKGVESREGGYGFQSINTRGFSDFSNSRFVQMIDGMDTAAQALSFSTGNFSGVSELDIHSVEILHGASSALYGANAYNGLMLMNTKNPFDYTGISSLFKTGYTSQKEGGNNPFYDASIRMAYKFNDYFAAKVNFSYYQAEEWHANDLRNKQIDTHQLIEGSREKNLNYNGVNIYGDEMFTDLSGYNRYLAQKKPGIEKIPFGTHLSRTGYTEAELLKNNFETNNTRFSTSLYFRPFKDERLEIKLASRLSFRNNLFQGASRFVQRNYYTEQHKLELKGHNFYLRGYYTGNDSGNSYDFTKTAIALEDNSLNIIDWSKQYVDQKYLNNKSITESRKLADINRVNPNTSAFNKELNKVTSTLISEGGGAIYEKSNYKHLDGNYNFKELLNNWADLQIGGSYRWYNPNSKGTLFNDYSNNIRIKEYGFYSQIQKKLLEDKLKLTASLRYDKATNFDGNYSPKIALNYALGKDKNHVFRTSFQTGFRNPTVQEQYQLLASAFKTNIGTVSDNLNRIAHGNNYYEAWDDASNSYIGKYRPILGDEIINNSLLTKTVYGDNKTYEKSDYKEVVPELVKTIELGYRSMFLLNKQINIDLDINGYYSKYDHFIFTQDVLVVHAGEVYPYGNRKLTQAESQEPKNKYGYTNEQGVLVFDEVANRAFLYGDVKEFNIITNSKSQIESYGFAFGMHTKLFRNFDFGANYSFNDYQFEDKDHGQFEPNFNTPKHSVKVQLGNNNVFNNFGFNINARWQDEYKWVSTFVKGNVAARTVLDAQLNYRIPSMKSRIKVGGTNLFGKEYYVAPGSGQIGQLYYISWSINN